MHLCLFDIDGTLLRSGGAGQAAMESALESVFGVTAPTRGVAFAGRTDFAITSEMLRYHGVEPTDRNRQEFLSAYLNRLPDELAEREGLILPGIAELLEHLSSRTDTQVGLLTGNVRRGAETKLTHYGLWSFFSCGGFGDDHLERDDVARSAVKDARRVHSEFQIATSWVIGDTPADVQCGRAIGARVIAVATGSFTADELHQARPDFLFEDFSDVSLVLEVFRDHDSASRP